MIRMDKEDVREEAISQTREEVQGSVDRDKLLVKAVKQLDQLENDFREEVERLRDWHAVHFPELEQELTEDDRFVDILEKYGVGKTGIEPFKSMADKSTGSQLSEKDKKLIESSVATVASMKDLREELEKYIEEGATEEFQNLSVLLGPVLTTRLVALAGGLEELAKKPASTVQMLGAEKALFRHLHGEGSPPKHGVLFQHRFVKNLPEVKRGKMARFLANKSVIAARIDQYGDEDKSEQLRKEIEDKYDNLR